MLVIQPSETKIEQGIFFSWGYLSYLRRYLMLWRKKICGPLQFNYLSCVEKKIGQMKDDSKSLERR